MSLCRRGPAEELRGDGIAGNALWPRTLIATAAIEFAVLGEGLLRLSRRPEIVADAACVILNRPARELSGQFCIDDSVLYEAGVRDFEPCRVDPSQPLLSDFLVPASCAPPPGVVVGAAAPGQA